MVIENQQAPLRSCFSKKQDAADGDYLESTMRHFLFLGIPPPFAGQGVLRRQE